MLENLYRPAAPAKENKKRQSPKKGGLEEASLLMAAMERFLFLIIKKQAIREKTAFLQSLAGLGRNGKSRAA